MQYHQLFWWVLRTKDRKASNAVNCKSTLIKLFTILQVTNPFSKYTFLIKIIYFCVNAFKQQFELIKTFDDIAPKNAQHFKVFFPYKTNVIPNFLVEKTNITHKPSIFTKKILWINVGRCLESLALVREGHLWEIHYLPLNLSVG